MTPAGVSGNNSRLASQTNVGIDLGTDWTPDPTVKLSVTGFYEFFRNELVTQSPGARLQNCTFDVPKSVHRGVEVARTGGRFPAGGCSPLTPISIITSTTPSNSAPAR